MGSYIARRVLYGVATLFVLSLIIFVAIRLGGGDPATLLAQPGASEADLERIRAMWGLDQSWPVQYLTFMGNLFTGDLGSSLTYGTPVVELYMERLPASIELAVVATLFSVLFGVTAGVVSAIKVDTWWDRAAKGIGLVGLSVPGFWLALMLILIFSIWLEWLPTSGRSGPETVLMPAAALGWYLSASLLRLTRSSMLEALSSDYVKFARLKGVPERVVIFRHAFRNAAPGVLTLAGLNLSTVVSVGVVIEVVFAWPGVGSLLFDGIFNRDFPLVQAVVILDGLIIIAVNLCVDISHAYLDRRVVVAASP